jgi:hypothetical protein
MYIHPAMVHLGTQPAWHQSKHKFHKFDATGKFLGYKVTFEAKPYRHGLGASVCVIKLKTGESSGLPG